ncbi:MAG: hypothetical protein IKP02_08035 [Paludibacteraceae bacterium]|nr:hypothetical protein [Paludibacteraceae bacterium]
MKEAIVNLRIDDRIAFITMQDAEHFNCLSEQMCRELMDAIDEAYAAECVGIIISAECKRGVWSAGHNIHELPMEQLGINKAREMFFTANPITAEDALNVGLVNHIAPEAALPALLEEKFCAPLRRNSVLSVSAIKRQFRILSKAASTMSSESFERINAYRTKVYRGEDYKEGINAFFEKRSPEYKGKAADLD